MDREKKIIKTSIQGILVNVILVVFKAIVGIFANSIAIVLDAVNNLTDAISSIITIIGTKLANKAPDKEHPFGHGRIEYLTSTIVSAIVLLAGITAVKESIEKIINPEESNYSIISLVIIAVAVIVKFIFGRYVKNIGKKVNSQSLVAAGQDAFMDSVLSFTTLVAAIINYIWHLSLEGYLGVIIGIVIIKSAIEMLKETVNDMIGQRADIEIARNIKEEVCAYEEVQGAYDLTLHNYGPSKTIATVHIQVRDDMTANEIHSLTREISTKIYEKYGILTTIGIYAANDKGEFAEIKKELLNTIQNYKEIKQVHGFYVDKENNNIYFDLIIDFECKNPENVKEKIIKELKEKFPEYEYNVILDADFSD
ncbi:MAG: cation diffusion facilitator family transporter [Clostridia bacterium]|nr:cation diffusion facilitator family transporter [Clostridia bacterium]